MDYKKLGKNELIKLCNERRLSFSSDWDEDVLIETLKNDDQVTKDWIKMMNKIKNPK